MKRTPLKRKTRLKVKGKSRFPKRRNDAYRRWIRTFPCCVVMGHGSTHWHCEWPAECAHVVSRGAGGYDVANCVPLCRKHHHEQHALGLSSFERRYACDLLETAATYGRRWREQQGETAA